MDTAIALPPVVRIPQYAPAIVERFPMPCPIRDRLTPTDRAALVLTALVRGRALSTQDIVMLTGLAESSVYSFMCRLSLHSPVYSEHGRWHWCDGTETGE